MTFHFTRISMSNEIRLPLVAHPWKCCLIWYRRIISDQLVSMSIFVHSSSWWSVRPSKGDQEMQTLDHYWLWNQLPCGSSSEFLYFFFFVWSITDIHIWKWWKNEIVFCILANIVIHFHYKALCFHLKMLSVHTIFFQKLIIHTEML